MARSASPWFWDRRNCWAVIVDGQRHVLGPHPDPAPPRKKKNRWVVPRAIQDLFDDLKVSLRRPDPPPADKATVTVGEVLEKFLDWCSKNRSPRTYEWSRNHIQSFVNGLKARPLDPKSTLASGLEPYHVTEWADAKPKWGPNHKRGAITAVQRAFSWAEKMGHIAKSPVRHVEKPPPKRREQILTAAEFGKLLAEVKDQAFRDVLNFCWETGCRVVEVRLLEARHYRPDRGRFEVPPAEAKGKKRWRVIYLTDAAAAIVERLANAHPEGPLFRNTDGRRWDAQNFNCRFCRLQKKLGVKYALTAIRHSFATRLLEAGVDHLTVSALLGHADGSMLARVYSHVGERTDFLRTELLRASGAGTAA